MSKLILNLLIAMFDLQLFASPNPVNATIGYVNPDTGGVTAFTPGVQDLSPENKTFYDTALLENAREKHYFAQFAKKQALPRNHGQNVEWRKFATLPKAMTPLTEGVTPDGKKMHVSVITQSINQYGDYVALTDKIELHAIDKVVLAATEELGAAAGNTQDALIRNELMTGTNVIYADKVTGGVTYAVTKRWGLDGNCRLTPKVVNKAVTKLKKDNAPTINGNYVALIPYSVAEDLREDAAWIDAHKYASPEQIFNGEIGMLHNVRFIETGTVRVIAAKALNGSTSRYLTCASSNAYINNASATTCDAGKTTQYRITITETPSAELVGRLVLLEHSAAITAQLEIVGVDVTNKYLYINQPASAPANSDYLNPGEGGAELHTATGPNAVYMCEFLGREGYAMIDPEGGSMETIVKSRGSGGTADPLNQRSTVGYKFEQATKILYEERVLRVECGSSYSLIDEDNE